MKKTVSIIFVITWLALFVFFVFTLLNKFIFLVPDNNLASDNEKASSDYLYADYPLIEYCFDTQDDWAFIICENVYGDTPKYYVNTSNDSLEFNKEKIVINTFPVCRGTTETHIVILQKNGKTEKVIYCHDYMIESEDFAGDFLEVKNLSIDKLVSN